MFQRPCQEIDEISERVLIDARSGPLPVKYFLTRNIAILADVSSTAFSAALRSPNYCVVTRIGIFTQDPWEIEKETGTAWFIENDRRA